MNATFFAGPASLVYLPPTPLKKRLTFLATNRSAPFARRPRRERMPHDREDEIVERKTIGPRGVRQKRGRGHSRNRVHLEDEKPAAAIEKKIDPPVSRATER